MQEEIAEHLPGITGAHLFLDDGIGKVLMSLSTLSSTMSVRDHMITNRLPSSVRVPVVPQRHQFVDYDVLYAILMAPDVVSVSSLDVIALKVIISHLKQHIILAAIFRNVSVTFGLLRPRWRDHHPLLVG